MTWLRHNWRTILSRAPLPMLALAASYGVYSFALLFVPEWVACVQAAAFEATYIGLSVVDVPEAPRRRRAVTISIGAVLVSVIYNSASGYIHRNPDAIIGAAWYVEALLAIAHGAPLAIVAGLNADLLLHTHRTTVSDDSAATPVVTAPDSAPVSLPVADNSVAPLGLSRTAQVRALAQQLGVSESKIWRDVRAGRVQLET